MVSPTNEPAFHQGKIGSGRSKAGWRYVAVGAVLLVVAVGNLIVVVDDWSEASNPGDFFGNHWLQIIGVVIGVTLVIVGIVKALRER